MHAAADLLGRHDLRFVGLAGVICLIGCAAGLSAYRRACLSPGRARWGWAAVSGVLLGSAAWATHVIAMLAYESHMAMGFEFERTALSLLIVTTGAVAGVWISSLGQALTLRLAGGALCGTAISAMHFLGMAGMQLPATLQWDGGLVTLACVIGAGGTAAAFAAGGNLFALWSGGLATALFAAAVLGLHFTAMSAVTLHHGAAPAMLTVFGREYLAMGAGALDCMILVAGAGMLVVDRFSKLATLSALHHALDRAPTALAFFDRDHRLLFWNAGYARLLWAYGIEPCRGAVYGKLLRQAVAAGLPQKVAAAGMQLDSIDDGLQLEQFCDPEGRWMEAHLASTGDGGFVVMLQDITAHRELAERQTQAREAAEEASQAKTQFLANMSHEIRTPLNAVLGMVQVMERDELSAPQRSRLEVIGQSGRVLLSTLNDILDLSKIEAGKLSVESAPFDLAETVTATLAAYQPLAAQKEIRLDLQLARDAQGWWLGDAARLRQVLSNLLSNALKFTSEGQVAVTVDAGPGGVRIAVDDTGIGIPQDRLGDIFEKFTQADASTTRRFGGTGLGLSISQQFVELMGGAMSACSVEGQGSCFSFTLPLARTAAPAAAAARSEASVPHRKVRILAAEDNPTNRLILAALLEPLDAELVLTRDGQEAVEAFEADIFDVVLLDAQMPVLNGCDASRQMRLIERLQGRPRTPILALTANVMEHQMAEYREAGMDGLVAKPIEAGKLFDAIDDVLAVAPGVPQALAS